MTSPLLMLRLDSEDLDVLARVLVSSWESDRYEDDERDVIQKLAARLIGLRKAELSVLERASND